MTGKRASTLPGGMLSAGLIGSLALLCGILLFGSLVDAQQPGSPPANEQGDCITSDAITGGVRNPPRPEVVQMREACLGQKSGGAGQSVDTSASVGHKLDQLYDTLTREADEGAAAGSAGSSKQ